MVQAKQSLSIDPSSSATRCDDATAGATLWKRYKATTNTRSTGKRAFKMQYRLGCNLFAIRS